MARLLLRTAMLDPITASLAIGAGANIAGGLTTAATNAVQNVSNAISASAAKATFASGSFQTAYANLAAKVFQKLFASHPELKDQLTQQVGAGPYTLTQNTDGTLQISSQTTGNSMTLNNTTAVGQQATSLANSFELKNLQNGLELATV